MTGHPSGSPLGVDPGGSEKGGTEATRPSGRPRSAGLQARHHITGSRTRGDRVGASGPGRGGHIDLPRSDQCANTGQMGDATAVHRSDYRRTPVRRVLDVLSRAAIAAGVGPGHRYLLTVVGRHTGRRYSTPIGMVADGESRWLVAPYGEVGWTRNAREAGRVELSRGRRATVFRLLPAPTDEAARVLKAYLALEPITRPYFDAATDDPEVAFAAEVERHPVFRLLPA